MTSQPQQSHGFSKYMLFNRDGTRAVQAEKQLSNVNELRVKYEKMALRLAEQTQMLESKQYVPADDAEAAQLHREAQRTAAGLAAEVIQTMRTLMLTSKRPTVRLEAAKALFEIGGRIAGGDGKGAPLPGSHVIVVDREALVSELEQRRAKGKL